MVNLASILPPFLEHFGSLRVSILLLRPLPAPFSASNWLQARPRDRKKEGGRRRKKEEEGRGRKREEEGRKKQEKSESNVLAKCSLPPSP